MGDGLSRVKDTRAAVLASPVEQTVHGVVQDSKARKNSVKAAFSPSTIPPYFFCQNAVCVLVVIVQMGRGRKRTRGTVRICLPIGRPHFLKYS